MKKLKINWKKLVLKIKRLKKWQNIWLKIIASDRSGLQMISACSSGAKVKVADIKYLQSTKVFLYQFKEIKLKIIMIIK